MTKEETLIISIKNHIYRYGIGDYLEMDETIANVKSDIDELINHQTSSLQLRVKELEEALKEAHETFGGIEDIANKEGYLSTNKIWSWANYAARQISNVLNKALK